MIRSFIISDNQIQVQRVVTPSFEFTRPGRKGTKNSKKKQRDDKKRHGRRSDLISENVLAAIDMSGTLRCEFETVRIHDRRVSVIVKGSPLWDHDGIRYVIQRLM